MAAVNAAGRADHIEPLAPVEDARAGELYARHSGRVLAYCLSRLGRREDAEDAVQTTFLHAVGGLRRGVVPSHELAWLLGIARNVCLTRLESAGRRGRLELVCDPVELERSEAPNGRRDELIGVEDALARLPEQQRRAVLLRDWRGLSYEEVAAQLGVSLANAETLIFRGRRTLAELLREEPAATRRRLRSLGDVGSLFTWVKSAFTGAAAASKLAAAVVVVAAGTGVVVGVGAPERGPKAPEPTPAIRASATTPPPGEQASRRHATPTNVPSDKVSQGSHAPTGASRTPASRALPAREPAGDAPAAPPSSSDTGSQAPPAASAPPPTTPARVPAVPKTSDAVPAAKAAVGSTVRDVGDTVEQLAPAIAPVTEAVTGTVVDTVEALPVPEVPIATPPLVESVAEAVPPVTVTAPTTVPTEPITVDLPKLLP